MTIQFDAKVDNLGSREKKKICLCSKNVMRH